MKYVILIQSNPQSLAVWETLTDQQRADLSFGHLRLTEEMREAGVLVASEGLGDPILATQVSVRDGRTITSDGPHTDVQEHLAGFYLIDVADLDEAVAWAAKAPDAAYTRVEVRPILNMSTWEL
ncbi:YciI family protein [Dactylosporangium sp. NPDC049525]|uniref:YciI family protein n=1 Tax=Dactylosporangium sp. NPDC049525 TaxID=3154730 RepID=UPI003415AFEA